MLTQLQTQVTRVLQTALADVYPGVSVVCVDKADALQIVAEAIAQSGTAVLVAPPSMTCQPAADVGPLSTEGGVRIIVQVIEAPEVSREQGVPTAVALAERIAWLLHSCNHPQRADDVPLGVTGVNPVPDDEDFVMEVSAVCTGQITDPDSNQPNDTWE